MSLGSNATNGTDFEFSSPSYARFTKMCLAGRGALDISNWASRHVEMPSGKIKMYLMASLNQEWINRQRLKGFERLYLLYWYENGLKWKVFHSCANSKGKMVISHLKKYGQILYQKIALWIRVPTQQTARNFEFPLKKLHPFKSWLFETFKGCPDSPQPVDHPYYRTTYQLKKLAKQLFCRSDRKSVV